MTTAEKIKALLAESTKLADGATPGPWKLCGNRKLKGKSKFGMMLLADFDSFEGDKSDAPNAAFTAAARTAMPARDRALLVAVDALGEARCTTDWSGGRTCLEIADRYGEGAICIGCKQCRSLISILAILTETK